MVIERPLHPYARRHLASHAAEGEILEDVLYPDTLPYLDEERLSGVLRLTQAPPGSALWTLLGAWRSVRHRWSWNDPDANAAALDLALLASGGSPAIRHTASGLTWVPRWAEWTTGGTIVGHVRGLSSAAFGIVAERPIIVGASWELRLWDAATGQLLGEPLHAPDVRAVAIADSCPPVVVAVGPGWMTIWDAATHVVQHAIELPGAIFRSVALGRLGDEWIVVAGGMAGGIGGADPGGVVHVRSARTGEAFGPVWHSSDSVRAVALAETSSGLVAAVGYGNGTVELWDVEARQLVGPPVPAGAEVNALALTELDGRLVLGTGASDGVARVWDARAGEPITPPCHHMNEVRTVALGHVGPATVLASGSLDRTAMLWDATGGHPLDASLKHPEPVNSVAFGRVDGRMMLATACADGNTRLWDPVKPSAARVFVDGRFRSVAVVDGLRDGVKIVVAGNDSGRVQVWSGYEGSRREDIPVSAYRPAIGKGGRLWIQVAAGHVQGRLLVLTSIGGLVELWELDVAGAGRTGRLAMYPAHERQQHPVALYVGNNRALLAAQVWSKPPIMIDAVSGEALRVDLSPLEQPTLLGFSSSQDRVFLITVAQEQLWVHDVATGQKLGPPVAVASGTRHAAIGVLDDVDVLAVLNSGQLQLWNARTGEEWLHPITTSNVPTGVAFAKVAGRDLVLTAHYETVRVWNPRTGRKLSELPFGTSIEAMSVHETAEGAVLVAIGGPGVLLTELRDTTEIPHWTRGDGEF